MFSSVSDLTTNLRSYAANATNEVACTVQYCGRLTVAIALLPVSYTLSEIAGGDKKGIHGDYCEFMRSVIKVD